jgi:hypothetical protein
VCALFQVEPGKLTQTVALTTYIQEVFGSGLSQDTSCANIYHNSTASFQVTATQYLKLGHSYFLLYPSCLLTASYPIIQHSGLNDQQNVVHCFFNQCYISCVTHTALLQWVLLLTLFLCHEAKHFVCCWV